MLLRWWGRCSHAGHGGVRWHVDIALRPSHQRLAGRSCTLSTRLLQIHRLVHARASLTHHCRVIVLRGETFSCGTYEPHPGREGRKMRRTVVCGHHDGAAYIGIPGSDDLPAIERVDLAAKAWPVSPFVRFPCARHARSRNGAISGAAKPSSALRDGRCFHMKHSFASTHEKGEALWIPR